MTKLSKWLKGNLKDNVKETFEATIEHLLKLKPPIKKGNKRQALMSSLQALMKNDESVREEYESLNAWVNVNNSEKEKEKNLKIVDKEHQAMFKKARVVQYNISYGAGSTQMQNSNNITSEHEVSTDIKEAQEINPLNGQKVKEEKEDNLLSRIPHKFSFSASKQGSYVEPILEHVEKALFRFVVKNRDYIPSDTARNHHVHGITKSKGKWNDEKLQRLSTLALELVDCLGDEDAFESLLVIKQNLSSELTEQYVLPMKRRHENNEDEIQERKRHMTDEELGELIDFALNIETDKICVTHVS
ncbi:20297_t:CDS:2 [Entrophospora sp. SA101]|nr:20297_t:CDS:2 [Entrophospora sp. SA101]